MSCELEEGVSNLEQLAGAILARSRAHGVRSDVYLERAHSAERAFHSGETTEDRMELIDGLALRLHGPRGAAFASATPHGRPGEARALFDHVLALAEDQVDRHLDETESESARVFRGSAFTTREAVLPGAVEALWRALPTVLGHEPCFGTDWSARAMFIEVQAFLQDTSGASSSARWCATMLTVESRAAGQPSRFAGTLPGGGPADPGALLNELRESFPRTFVERAPATERPVVVFAPAAAAQLLAALSRYLVAEGSSTPLSFLLGDALADASLTIVDDPMDGPRVTPFDGEGRSCAPAIVIDHGVLSRLIDGRTSGQSHRADYRTAPRLGASNLRIEPQQPTAAELWIEARGGYAVHEIVQIAHALNGMRFDVRARIEWLAPDGERGRHQWVRLGGELLDIVRHVRGAGGPLCWATCFGIPGYFGAPSILVEGATLDVMRADHPSED